MGQWLYFAFVQFVALIAMVIGWFLLIIPCALRAWKPVEQIYTPDWVPVGTSKPTIQIWTWNWLNKVWGNDEDGVIGPTWYNTTAIPSAKLAYLWSAWRNSANNLRFIFKNVGGPLFYWENSAKTWYFQCGWYPNGFPVLSAGKI